MYHSAAACTPGRCGRLVASPSGRSRKLFFSFLPLPVAVARRLSRTLAGIRTVSAIETILEKDTFTLEELYVPDVVGEQLFTCPCRLDEDELLQEVRSENANLLN